MRVRGQLDSEMQKLLTFLGSPAKMFLKDINKSAFSPCMVIHVLNVYLFYCMREITQNNPELDDFDNVPWDPGSKNLQV